MKCSVSPCRVLTLTAAAVFAGRALLLEAQSGSPPPLTAAQFKSLPDDALVGGVPKRQVVQQLEKLKADFRSQLKARGVQIQSAVDGKARTHAQTLRMRLVDGNQRLRSSLAPSLATKEVSRDKNLVLKLPTVSEVIPATVDGKPAARPGGWIAVKGKNLDDFCPGKSGKVLLKGNFAGGFVTLVVNGDWNFPCSAQAFMTGVPADIAGVVDHQAKVVLQTGDGHDVDAGHPVDFIATREIKGVEANVVSVGVCSPNATYDNQCDAGLSWLAGIHILLPDSKYAEGTDIFQYKFANGWKLYEVSDPYMHGDISCKKATDVSATTTWSVTAFLGSLRVDYSCTAIAEGPKGVPMAQ